MDNGHQQAIFSPNPEVDDNLNEENWQKSLEISKPVDLPSPEKIANIGDSEAVAPESLLAPDQNTATPETPSAPDQNTATPETSSAPEEISKNPYELGQVTSVGPAPSTQSEATLYNPANIKTTGDYLDKGSLAEIEKLEHKLSQDGDLNSFYDETRNLTAVNLSNSFNRKLYDNGGES